MKLEGLSQAIQDYLKALYRIQEGRSRVSTQALAEALGVSPASATHMIKRLAEMGLAEHTPYRGAVLTAEGERVALEVIRHHRLLEQYLAKVLGFPWDRVHEEADRLEHHVSEQLESRMAEALGEPETDPHGHPIPSPEGDVAELPRLSLAELSPGRRGRLAWVRDDDPEVLRYMKELGLLPGSRVEVLDRAPFDGPIRVRVEGQEQVVGRRVAEKIFVTESEVQTPKKTAKEE
ncbi:MAG: metal-dependent transcriptional regulator [Anaerolineae bacterium]